MRKFPNQFQVVILVAGLFGCADRMAGGAGAGNPPLAEVTLALQAKSTSLSPLAKGGTRVAGPIDTALSVKDSAGATLILSAIEVRVAKVEFSGWDSATCAKPQVQCLEKEFGLNGDYSMNLISGISKPPIGILKIPPGTYTQIGLEPVAPDPNPASTGPKFNFLLSGKKGSEPGGQSFSIELNLAEGLDFVDSAGIRITKDSLNKIVLALKVDGWFSEMNMQACLDKTVPDSSGISHLLESGPCREALERFKNKIGESEEIDGEFEE